MTLMERRRALVGAKTGGRIPTKYQEVEWISGTRDAHITTKIFPFCTTTIVDFQYTKLAQSQTIFGCWNANNNRYYGFRLSSDSKFNLVYVNRNNQNTVIGPVGTTRHTAVFNASDGKVLLDGNTVGTSTALDLTTKATNPIRIFSYYGGTAQDYPSIKIFHIAFFDRTTGDCLGDFVPCYQKSDGEIGMYDLVTQLFYKNDDASGTGTFTKGADV